MRLVDSIVPDPLEDLAAANLAERKLALLQRGGLFGKDTKGATIKRATTGAELAQAYALVHDVFAAKSYLEPDTSGIRLRIFEASSETATFIAERHGKVVGVLSVVGDSPDLGLPSDRAFKAELDICRTEGRRLCEITNQAVVEEYRRSAVPTELMRCAIAHAMQAGFDETVGTVSPTHRGFYDLMGFNSLGSERSYSTTLYDPVIALRLDLNSFRQPAPELSGTQRFIHDFVTEGNQFWDRVGDWARSARRQFLNAELLEQLFVRDRNFVAECSVTELRILQRRWGEEMFHIVTGIIQLASAAAPWAEPDSDEIIAVPGKGAAAWDLVDFPSTLEEFHKYGL